MPAAQDSVFSHVDEAFVDQNGWVFTQTLCADKDEYLTRPDRGRRFDEQNQAIIQKTFGRSPKVALVVGDGLSSAAIEATPGRLLAGHPAAWRPMAFRPAGALWSSTAGWGPAITSEI